MKKFVLVGAAGYIAPRHMKAIKDTGNVLVAAFDPFDSVGVIDSYFPDADFFTEFERFDRHVDKLKRGGNKVDFVSICSPNYLHDAHIRFGLRQGADVICEKPLVLNPWNVDGLIEVEKETGKKVNTILQLRLHEKIIALKKLVDEAPDDKIFDVTLTYITSRGQWYFRSWKGNVEKSGGVATNIGIHFFDMLSWVFGEVQSSKVHLMNPATAAGSIQFKKANVRWFLSIDANCIPVQIREAGKKTYRLMMIDGEEFEFSDGFTELHTTSYQQIIAGGGFGLEEAKNAIVIAHQLRNSGISGLTGDYHPFCIENK